MTPPRHAYRHVRQLLLDGLLQRVSLQRLQRRREAPEALLLPRADGVEVVLLPLAQTLVELRLR